MFPPYTSWGSAYQTCAHFPPGKQQIIKYQPCDVHYIMSTKKKRISYPTKKKYNGSEGHVNYFAIITITI